jgi:5'-nucleotidase
VVECGDAHRNPRYSAELLEFEQGLKEAEILAKAIKPLVIGLSSRALLNLEKEDVVFKEQGVEAFIQYQRENQDVLIPKGVAFGLVKSLSALNSQFAAESPAAVQVVIISRNHPDCGVRILRSLTSYGLEIPMAAFTGGGPVIPELKIFNVDLFLSYEENDVIEAVKAGVSAAKIFGGPGYEDRAENAAPLLAFDGDSTLFSNEGDLAFARGGMEEFRRLEFSNSAVPLKEGPMYRFVQALAEIQRLAPISNPPFRMVLVTARNFPFMQRPIETLRSWGIRFDKAYLIGNMKKSNVLRSLHAVMFFDDNLKHCADAAEFGPVSLVLNPEIVPVVAPIATASASSHPVRLDRFTGICKLVLRKEYAQHETTLLSMYESKIVGMDEAEFTSKMSEFERSYDGEPKGSIIRNRQAVGPENTDFYRLRSFLDNLLRVGLAPRPNV